MKIGTPSPRANRIRRLALISLPLFTLLLGIILGRADLFSRPGAILQQDAARSGPVAELPLVALDVTFADYDRLLAQRREALERGVVLATADDFVNADITYEGEIVPVRLRLQQGPVDALGEDDKWPFDLRARRDATLMGMGRFYLQDPAGDNWLNQWAFLETLRREGILAPRYVFVRLHFNGDDWGVYALQEGFATELPGAQGRPPGVMLEFAADRVWQTVAHFGGDVTAARIDPVTNMTARQWPYGEIDTFQTATLNADPTLAAQQAEAMQLLRDLQTGRRPASAVFDVAQYGRFLALVDLWGAGEALALTNLRFYYNPTTGRLEPIAFNGRPLGNDDRLSLTVAYQDPAIQAAYAQAAAAYSDPAYLVTLQEALASRWEALAGAMPAAAPVAPPWSALAERGEQIRRSLRPAQPLFAYLAADDTNADTLVLSVANVLNLPLEIVGIDVAGVAFLPAQAGWIAADSPALLDDEPLLLRAAGSGETAVLRYLRLRLPLNALHDAELPLTEPLDLRVVTRIWGLSSEQTTPVQPALPPLEVYDE